MGDKKRWVYLLVVLGLGLAVVGCAPAYYAPPPAEAPEEKPVETPVEATVKEPRPTPTPAATPTAPPPMAPQPTPPSEGTKEIPPPGRPPAPPEATPTPEAIEQRIVEVEWPPRMRLGNSEVLRLAFIPSPEGGYVPVVEEEGHEVEATAVVPIPEEKFRRYWVYAVPALSSINFEIDPPQPVPQEVLPGQPNVWRWSIKPRESGEHKLNLSLALRWEPREAGSETRVSEQQVWSDTFSVSVHTSFGLNVFQADILGVLGSVVGGALGLPFVEDVLKWLFARLRRFRQL